MATVEIVDDNFREIYQKNEIVILDFWAVWCGPCQQFTPVFEAVSEQYSDVVFGKVETESQQKLSGYFGIRSIPSVIIIRAGLEVFRHSGLMDRNQLITVISQVQDLNMDEVRQKIEEEEAQVE